MRQTDWRENGFISIAWYENPFETYEENVRGEEVIDRFECKLGWKAIVKYRWM